LRVLITGSRDVGADPNIARSVICNRLFDLPVDSTIVHGAARGVDRIAAQEAEKLGLLVEPHRPDYERYGPKRAPHVRNQHMVNLGADICLAFWDGKSEGTKTTIEKAEKAGIPVEVISF
jgi:hypothetical protein